MRGMQEAQAFPGLPDSWSLAEDEERFETPAEAMQYAQDVAELMGYEYGNIHFTADLPQYVGGATTPQYTLDEEGSIVFHSNDILISDAVLPFDVPSRYETAADVMGQELGFEDGADDFVDTLYHELVHGMQYRDIWSAEEPYTEDDLEALRLLHEGQAATNADGASYRDAQQFYDRFLGRVEDGETPGEALHGLSEDYVAAVVQLGTDGPYDFVVADRDRFEDVDDLYEAAATAYGMDVDTEASYEIDYREMDADALGEHILRVQDAVDEGYEAVAAAGYDLPTAASDA